MNLEPHVRNLHAAILCAKAEGLFSERDRARHYDLMLRAIARRAGAAPESLEDAHRAAYGCPPAALIERH